MERGKLPFTVRLKITLVSAVGVIALSIAAVLFGISSFRSAITVLNRQDYRERIRTAELDYGSVDSVSGATGAAGTDAVSAASEYEAENREAILSRLNSRYSHASGTAVPFIINGDRELILFVEQNNLKADFFSQEMLERILESREADFTSMYKGRSYWLIYSYYENWDWYTGYVLLDTERFSAVNRFALQLSMALFCGTLIIVSVLVVVLGKTLRPLETISRVLRATATGDLAQEVAYAKNDEIGEIAESFRSFQTRLKDIVTGIQQASERNLSTERTLGERTESHFGMISEIVSHTGAIREEMTVLNGSIRVFSDSTDSLHRIITALDEKTNSQLSAVSETTASVEQMTASLRNVTQIASTKRASTRNLLVKAEIGGEKLHDTVDAISEIHANIDRIAETVEMIRNIATQTNLLSMNAAIEAAHAGDAGKGFSVVAEEIRKLAEDSNTNSGTITDIINDIIARIQNADAMGREAHSAFIEINQEIRAVSASYDEISASTDQLSAGTGEIISAMTLLNTESSEVRRVTVEANTQTENAEKALNDIIRIAQAVMKNIETIDGQSQQSRSVMEEIRGLVLDLKTIVEALSERANFFSTDDMLVSRQPGTANGLT